MKFTAEHYFRAAQERILDAALLYERQRFGLAMYAAGLAVESLLRAFRFRIDPVFDSRHDLQILFRESGIMRLHEDRLERQGYAEEEIRARVVEFRAAHNEIVRLWRNDYRFGNEGQIRGWLRTMGVYHRVKGDVLKASTRKLLTAAQLLLHTGVFLWTSKKK